MPLGVGALPSLLTHRGLHFRLAGREGKRSYLRTHILCSHLLLPTPPCPPPVSRVARAREARRASVVALRPGYLSSMEIRPAVPRREPGGFCTPSGKSKAGQSQALGSTSSACFLVQPLAHPPPGARSLYLPPQFSHLPNGDKNSTHHLGLWWGFSEVM